MKAMIMGAGFGTRLRPFTELLPKPLIPLCNRPLLDYTLAFLGRNRVTSAVINTHHLAHEIARYVEARSHADLPLAISHEPEILNLGGGLKQAEPFFDTREAFVVYHGDVVAMFDLSAAIAEHEARDALVTMLLCRPAPDGVGPEPTVSLAHDGRVATIADHPAPSPVEPGEMLIFSGVHLVSPRIFTYLPPGEASCLVRGIYPQCIAAGERLQGVIAEGYWSDLGTPASYLAANFELLERRAEVEAFYGFSLGDEMTREEWIAPVLIGADCQLGAGAQIGPFAILGAGSRVAAGARVRRSVVWPEARVEGEIDGEIVSGRDF